MFKLNSDSRAMLLPFAETQLDRQLSEHARRIHQTLEKVLAKKKNRNIITIASCLIHLLPPLPSGVCRTPLCNNSPPPRLGTCAFCSATRLTFARVNSAWKILFRIPRMRNIRSSRSGAAGCFAHGVVSSFLDHTSP